MPLGDVLETELDCVSSKLTFTSKSENLLAAMKSSTLSLYREKTNEEKAIQISLYKKSQKKVGKGLTNEDAF